MGCSGSKGDTTAGSAPATKPSPTSTEAQKEAQRKFKEAQSKLEKEKAEKKRLSMEANALKEEALRQEALKKANAAEQEANEQAVTAIANQMVADIAEKQIEESHIAEEEAKEEQQKQATESFKGMGAKRRFRAALDAGEMDIAKDSAACMLQNAWRAKCAKKLVAFKKAEKKRLLENGMARKIQSLFRVRKAKRQCAAKREEKKAILEAEMKRREEAEAARIADEQRMAEEERQAEEMKQRAEEAAEVERQAEEARRIAAEAVAVANVVVDMGPPAMKTGVIKKEGSLVKNWKVRHFVLRNLSSKTSRLTYYESAKATEPYGNDEKGFVMIEKTSEIINIAPVKFTLVTADGKQLKLEFLTEADKLSWKQAIEEHIHYCSK